MPKVDMTKDQAVAVFEQTMLIGLDHTDKVAVRTAFNDFTDHLSKDGKITEWQANNWVYPLEKDWPRIKKRIELAKKYSYRCDECSYEQKEDFWLCPICGQEEIIQIKRRG